MNPDLRVIEAVLLGEACDPSNLSTEAASVVLPLVRRVVGERDELREELEEARATLVEGLLAGPLVTGRTADGLRVRDRLLGWVLTSFAMELERSDAPNNLSISMTPDEAHPYAGYRLDLSIARPEHPCIHEQNAELRAALEEARLTLAAEQGRAEGAPFGWRNDISHEWIRDWPPTETRYGTILWAIVRGDPVGGYVLMGKIKARGVPAYADLPGFGTAPDGKELWLFSTARAAMLAADKALFESRRTRCLAKALQLQADGVILYPPNGTHQQTPAIMIDRLSDPDLTEAVLAIYEKVLFL